MDGNELKIERQSSFSERTYIPQEQYDLMKKYSKDWKIKDILEVLRKDIEYFNSGECRSRENAKEAWESEEVRRTLERISSELLSRSPSENVHLKREIQEMEHAYKNVMERFLAQMEKFLHSIRELREDLKRTVKEFHSISRWTARITLASSTTEVALLTFNTLSSVLFSFESNPKVFLISNLIESLSITTSLFALSYMKQSSAEISKDVRDENRLFMDLVILHRRGNWIDEDVLRFFPHGVDTDLFGGREDFEDRSSWRTYLCSAIILANVHKDEKLLKDEAFLTRVKAFVESQAADIWWHRIKMKKLLKVMMEKVNSTSTKELVADHEIHYQRTALHLYPVLIPWLLNCWNSTGIRIIFSSIAAILAFSDLASSDTEEFKKLKIISQKFEKDFEEMTAICNKLDNDYD